MPMPSGDIDFLGKQGKCWWSRHFKILLILYAVAHLPILFFFDARFWDDWSLYKGQPEVVLEIFREAGSPVFGKLHVVLQTFGWWVYPVITFLSFFLATVFTYKIVERLSFGKGAAFWIAALVAVLPVNFARIAAIDLPYTLTLTSFLFGWMLLASFRERKLFLRVGVLLGFGFSFQTGSFLVLYAAPVLMHCIQRWKFFEGTEVKKKYYSLIGSADLILLPVIYWVIKSYYLKPYGIFDGYNSPSVSFTVLINSLVPIFDFLQADGILVNVGCVIVIAVTFFVVPTFFIQKLPDSTETSNKNVLLFICAGFCLSYLGAFPYAAVGKLPSYSGWTSTRHQLTLTIGLSILLYGVIAFSAKKLKNRGVWIGTCLPLFFALLFILNWWTVYAEFYVDHLRQIALVKLIKSKPNLKSGNYIFLDSSRLNAFNTKPGLGEYAAIYGEATGLHDALILDYQSLGTYGGWGQFVDIYGKYLGAWAKTENVNLTTKPVLYVISQKENVQNKFFFALQMVIYRVFSPERERDLLERLIVIDGPFLPNIN